jgi:hypothetical protein
VVVALVEDSSVGRRQPDALVDGRVTEFKSLSRGASDATVKNQLRTAKGQAPNVVIDARGSGRFSATAIRLRTTQLLSCRGTGTGSASGIQAETRNASWRSRGRSLMPLRRRAGQRCSRTGCKATWPSIRKSARWLCEPAGA